MHIHKKKNNARLTPSTPKFTSCCPQNRCGLLVTFHVSLWSWLAEYLLFLPKCSFLWKKKKESLHISHLFPHKSFTKELLLMYTLVKAKLIPVWTTSIWTSFFFLRISEKLSFHVALEWKQILKLCKLSQNRSVGLWPPLLPPLCFSIAWPTCLSDI